MYGSYSVTGRLQQSKPNPIRRQRQFRHASVHKATVAGKIFGVAYWHAQYGQTLQGGGEPLEGVFIQHLVCPQKMLPRHWKDKELSSVVTIFTEDWFMGLQHPPNRFCPATRTAYGLNDNNQTSISTDNP